MLINRSSGSIPALVLVAITLLPGNLHTRLRNQHGAFIHRQRAVIAVAVSCAFGFVAISLELFVVLEINSKGTLFAPLRLYREAAIVFIVKGINVVIAGDVRHRNIIQFRPLIASNDRPIAVKRRLRIARIWRHGKLDLTLRDRYLNGSPHIINGQLLQLVILRRKLHLSFVDTILFSDCAPQALVYRTFFFFAELFVVPGNILIRDERDLVNLAFFNLTICRQFSRQIAERIAFGIVIAFRLYGTFGSFIRSILNIDLDGIPIVIIFSRIVRRIGDQATDRFDSGVQRMGFGVLPLAG